MATSAWPCFSGKTHVHEDVDMAHSIKWYHYQVLCRSKVRVSHAFDRLEPRTEARRLPDHKEYFRHNRYRSHYLPPLICHQLSVVSVGGIPPQLAS
jgi:hypothetical protein